MIKSEKNMKGFTLLELLIVIAILAILSAVLILILNPAETMKKSRDTQRMSDLATMKTAIGMYLTTAPSPVLDGSANTLCVGGTGDDSIFYSGAVTDGVTVATTFVAETTKTGTTVDGNGWLPIDFTAISGGSPISNLPVDPLNTVAVAGGPVVGDAVYRYSCDATDTTFEINSILESESFTIIDDKRGADGGNHATLYEVGSDLTILPNLNTF